MKKRAKQEPSDMLADLADKASEAIDGIGSVVVTVQRVDGGLGIVIGSDLNTAEEIKLLLQRAVERI